MPIRINLLAEAHALEDQRRRDPVKRAIWVAAAFVSLMLIASIWLQLKSTIAKSEMTKVQNQVEARKNEYQQVLANQRNLVEVTRRLAALNQMATNRLLYGTLLNAMQQATMDEVQLMRLRTEQSYVFIDEVKPKTNSDDRITPGRPASVTEKVTLTLEAKDSSAGAGDQVNKFKQAVAESPYFRNTLGKTNEVRLTSLSPPNSLDGKPFVLFTLECRYPEKTR